MIDAEEAVIGTRRRSFDQVPQRGSSRTSLGRRGTEQTRRGSQGQVRGHFRIDTYVRHCGSVNTEMRVRVRHCKHCRGTQKLAKPLVVYEEKCFVFLDWTAQCGPELISFEGRWARRRVEIIARVKNFISEILVNASVKIIRTRLRDDLYQAGAGSSVFRAERIRDDFILLNCVDSSCFPSRIANIIVSVVDILPIQRVIVRRNPHSAD